jgi:uncharacterized delta-60 repeat protein
LRPDEDDSLAAKIVAAGHIEDSSGGVYIGLARYNLDGSLDRSFGSGGLAVTNLLGNIGSTPPNVACVVQGDGKIVVVGSAVVAGWQDQFVLARYNTDGSLDTTFGSRMAN